MDSLWWRNFVHKLNECVYTLRMVTAVLSPLFSLAVNIICHRMLTLSFYQEMLFYKIYGHIYVYVQDVAPVLLVIKGI